MVLKFHVSYYTHIKKPFFADYNHVLTHDLVGYKTTYTKDQTQREDSTAK